MSGSVQIHSVANGNVAALRNTGNGLVLTFAETTDVNNGNRRNLKINSQTTDLSKALQLSEMVDGTTNWYDIYGTHNIPSLKVLGAADSAQHYTLNELYSGLQVSENNYTFRLQCQPSSFRFFYCLPEETTFHDPFLYFTYDLTNTYRTLVSTRRTGTVLAQQYIPDETSVQLYIKNNGGIDALPANALTMDCKKTDGTYSSAVKIYGEHNVTKGTADITAGTTSLTSGCIYLVYE